MTYISISNVHWQSYLFHSCLRWIAICSCYWDWLLIEWKSLRKIAKIIKENILHVQIKIKIMIKMKSKVMNQEN